jgi:hypothetical protein
MPRSERHVQQLRPREIVPLELICRASGDVTLFGWHAPVEDSLMELSGKGTPNQLDCEAEPTVDRHVLESAVDEPRVAAWTHVDFGVVETAVHVL